jgi:hypothetical protein
MFGLGAGVPVRVRPDTRAGARVQASASVGVVTVRGAVDVFPGTGSLPAVVEGTVGPQISF